MSQILFDIGVPEWQQQDPDFIDFYKWFAENIRPENVLTECELDKLAHIDTMTAPATVPMHSDIESIERKYPGITTYTDETVVELVADVEYKTDQLQLYNQLESDLELHNQRLNKCQRNKSLMVDRGQRKHDSASEELSKLAVQLQDIQMTNRMQMSEYGRCYENQSECRFVHQLDLSEYYDRLERIRNTIEMFVQNNFKTESNSNQNAEEMHTKNASKLEAMRDSLYETLIDALGEELKYFGLAATLREPFEPMTWDTMRMKIFELQQLKRDSELQITVQQSAVHAAFKQLANRHVDTAILKHTQSKLDRAEVRIERYKCASDMLSDQLMYADCLWILVNNDIYRMEKYYEFKQIITAYESELAASAKRIELMRIAAIADKPHDSVDDVVRMGLVAMDIEQQKPAHVLASKWFAEHLSKMYSEIDELMRQYSNKTYCTDEEMFNIKTIVEQLRKILQCGHLRGITFTDFNVNAQLRQIKTDQDALDADFTALKTRMTNEYYQPMRNEFWQAKHYLWIWFLTNPSTMEKIIAKLVEKVNTSTQTKSKALTGLLRK